MTPGLQSRRTVNRLLIVVLAVLALSVYREWSAKNKRLVHFPLSLVYTVAPDFSANPTDWTVMNLTTHQPVLRFTGHRVKYVAANRSSPGPWSVSINVRGSTFWSAVSRGSNGSCYAVAWLVRSGFTGIQYQDFGKVRRCEASLAGPAISYLSLEPR